MQLVILRKISSWSSNGQCSFANWLQHRSLMLNTSRCYCGEASLSKMWQNDQSHEKLEKHAPTNMYMTSKWEAINHLITTLGLIVILQITPFAFVDFREPLDSIYTSWFASSAIFTVWDLSSGQAFQKYLPVWSSQRLVQPKYVFSWCCKLNICRTVIKITVLKHSLSLLE